MNRSLMVVHAHPDDEVFSTGGVLAKYAAQGDRVVAVYCTRGEAGELHHPELEADEAIPRLGDIREGEVREAAVILGISDMYFLGYRDSGMAETDANSHPDAFMNAPLDEAVDRLLDIMRQTSPEVVITYDENGGYGHPDHIMCNRVTVAAFRRAQGEVWGPRKLYYSVRSRESFRRQVEGLAALGLKIPWIDDDFDFDSSGIPESQISSHIDIAPYASLKKRALAVHRTQIPADFYYLSIPDDALAEFGGVEYFLRIEPPSGPQEYETDLFEGLEERSTAERATSRIAAQ